MEFMIQESPDHSPTEGEGMDTNWVYGFVGAVAARLAKRAAVDGQRPSRDIVKHPPEIYRISYPPKKCHPFWGDQTMPKYGDFDIFP